MAITCKYTTGVPHFIEKAHLEPARLSGDLLNQVKKVVFHALDSLKLVNGASHSEIKISEKGKIQVIEVGGRMGGDYIGSHLVELSTGIDFVHAVIQIALGKQPDLSKKYLPKPAAIRYILSEEDIKILEYLKKEHPQYIIYECILNDIGKLVTDSSTRWGFFLFQADSVEELEQYLPQI